VVWLLPVWLLFVQLPVGLRHRLHRLRLLHRLVVLRREVVLQRGVVGVVLLLLVALLLGAVGLVLVLLLVPVVCGYGDCCHCFCELFNDRCVSLVCHGDVWV
jgi:hypothetical protein